MDTLKIRAFRAIKRSLDNLLFPNQNRFATYLYYLPTLAFANRHFMSTPEFMYLTMRWANELPRKFDLIIGIPRNGMLVAYLIGIQLGLPVATIDTFANNSFQIPTSVKRKEKYGHILLVDENVGNGVQMSRAKANLSKLDPTAKISTAAVFVTKAQD